VGIFLGTLKNAKFSELEILDVDSFDICVLMIKLTIFSNPNTISGNANHGHIFVTCIIHIGNHRYDNL
jgi:hypothetical protein